MRILSFVLCLVLAGTALAGPVGVRPGGGGGGGALDALIETCAEGEIIKVVSGAAACDSDSTGSGSLGSGLASTTNDITASGSAILFAGATESLLLTFTADTATFSSGTGIVTTAFPGTVSATTFVGALTGNSSTATALAANGADCATATHFAVGVDASGVAVCEAIADADVPNTITVDLAATVTTNANLTGDVTSSGNATTIGADKITEAMLKAVDAAADEECLTKEDTTGDFEWQACGSGSFDSTTVDATTWSDNANASNAWTFDVSGTDTVMTFGSGTLDYTGTMTATSFTSDASASPTFTFNDSDSASEASDATIVAAATDVGAGTEDVDVTISTQVNSTLTARVTIDADGNTTIPSLDVGSTGIVYSTGTLSSTDLEVLDDGLIESAEITNDTVSATDLADSLDLGGDTSFEIPNGASPTVNATGEIAVDSTNGQLLYYDGTAARAIMPDQHECMTIESPVDADSFLLSFVPLAVTVTRIQCIVDPAGAGESAVLTVQECDSAGDTCGTTDALTCDNDGDNQTTITDAAVAAGAYFNIDMGTITGTVTQVNVCVFYRVDPT